MDAFKKTVRLEKRCHRAEKEMSGETEKEYDRTMRVAEETEVINSLKETLFIANFSKLEKRFMEDVKKIDEAGDAMAHEITVEDFRKLISEIVLSLGNVDDYRRRIREHLENILKKDEDILKSIRKKAQREKRENKDKDREKKLREYMFSSANVDNYIDRLGKTKFANTGYIDKMHHNQIKSLVEQKTKLSKLREDALNENDSAKLILSEFRQVLRCNIYEGVYINQISNIIGKNGLLDAAKIPGSGILHMLGEKIDLLRNMVATEIHLLTEIPGQIIALRKEELLEKEDFGFLKELEEMTDLVEE